MPEPLHFQKILEERCLTPMPEGKMGDRSVMNKLPQIKSNRPYLNTNTAGSQDWVKKLLVGTERIPAGIEHFGLITSKMPFEASSFISLIAAADIVVNIADAGSNIKEYERSRDIHDETGQNLAVLDGIKSVTLAGGSGTVLGLKTFSMVQDVGIAVHHPITFTGSLATIQGALSWASVAIFGLYYVINGLRSCLDLLSWYQGRQWRAELLQATDPAEMIYKQLRARTYQINMTSEEEVELALKTGARWLEKIENASEGRLKIKDKKEAFRKLVMDHPEIIRNLIGDYGQKLTTEGMLMLFGKYMAYQNKCAEFEAECARKLGSKAVEAMKAGNKAALKEALALPEWIGPAIKIGLAVMGLAAVIAVSVLLSGSPMGVLLVLAGIAALAMIFITDAEALKAHLQSNEFRKRDRAFIYFTLALSVAAFAGVVGLTVATGGMAPFVVSLVLSAAWLGVNAYSAYALWRYDHRRWEVQKVVDLVTYRKFLETKPSAEDVARIKKKMTEEDQNDVNCLVNPLEELQERERKLQELHKEQMEELIKALLLAQDSYISRSS